MIYKEERISSERIYEGKILNLRKDIVTTVSGKPASREIVEHNGAVAMVALTDSGKIIMEKQYRYAIDEVIFEVPAGKIEKDEADSLTAAKRELREETGYVASELKKLGLIFPSVAYTEEGIEVYLCTGLTKYERNLDDDEAIDIFECDFDEVCRMAEQGKMFDAKSICAVLMARAQMKG